MKIITSRFLKRKKEKKNHWNRRYRKIMEIECWINEWFRKWINEGSDDVRMNKLLKIQSIFSVLHTIYCTYMSCTTIPLLWNVSWRHGPPVGASWRHQWPPVASGYEYKGGKRLERYHSTVIKGWPGKYETENFKISYFSFIFLNKFSRDLDNKFGYKAPFTGKK